ncbi:MAG: KH domain-containing protein [Thermoplasmata archaeon]
MLYARIPMDRLGVLIGPEGRTKKALEETTGVRLEVDSKTGEVTIDESKSEDPSLGLRVKEVVTAIARGFSEARALRLLEDDTYLRLYSVKDYADKRPRRLQLKGRVIGAHGRTRSLIEELTGAYVSVYGLTVSLIGRTFPLEVACRAVEMLLRGSEHAAVYRYLEGMRPALREEEKAF